MPITSSTHRGFSVPGGTVADTRLSDMQAVKSAIVAIDADLANIEAAAIQMSSKGVANGVAQLDSEALIPASILPSYVDDVLEYANFAALPVTGSSGKIYVTLNDNAVYRWGGSSYTEIQGSPGSTDDVAEGTINKYFTVARALAAAPVQSVAGRTGAVVLTVADVPDAAPLKLTQNVRSANYTTVLSDVGKHIFHPSADTTARTWTIPANASVPYEIGDSITFVNHNAAGVITIAITTDTMRLLGAGTTGNRTLAANGSATALKVTATEWVISGTGLT